MRVLRRLLTKTSRIGPGEWRSICGLVHYGCPDCGGVGDLQGLGIDKGGRVSHRVECERAGCGWGDFVQCEGWEG